MPPRPPHAVPGLQSEAAALLKRFRERAGGIPPAAPTAKPAPATTRGYNSTRRYTGPDCQLRPELLTAWTNAVSDSRAKMPSPSRDVQRRNMDWHLSLGGVIAAEIRGELRDPRSSRCRHHENQTLTPDE